MGGGAWKVAYADFVTAMMAFFLLMWILNMAPEDTKSGLAKFFTEGADAVSNISSPVGAPPDNPLLTSPGKLTTAQVKSMELQRSNLAILRSIKSELTEDGSGNVSSGITTDGKGVSLQLVPDLLFQPGTAGLAPGGAVLLDKVFSLMQKYKTYLVVRGHADSSETVSQMYPSLWELSAARANSVVEYLIKKGIDPKLMRSVAYADTQPAVPPTIPNAAELNGRVEFVFHRPEVMSTVINF